MKKTIICGLTGVLLTYAITGITYAQSSISKAKYDGQPTIEKFTSLSDQINEIKEDGPTLLNEINAQATRNFMRDYKNTADVKWFEAGDGLVVYFTIEGVKTKVYYTKKGNYECRVRSYYENNLAPAVRHLVKSTYYDFNIYCITEINASGKTAYFLNLESKTSWKMIKVVDNEMEVTQEYKKG